LVELLIKLLSRKGCGKSIETWVLFGSEIEKGISQPINGSIDILDHSLTDFSTQSY
jgi:hypothetical protein